MDITSILLVALIMGGERILIRGQDPTLGEGGSACCLSISVSVVGSYADLNGDYQLKRDAVSKPEEVCVNGCVYTKDGSPSIEEYCFKSESAPGGEVQCKVGKIKSVFRTNLTC